MWIEHKRLRSLLQYNPKTGLWVWLVAANGRIKVGQIAGSPMVRDQRRVIRIDKKLYLASRLAWFYMTGNWPREIDHKNGDPTDDRWRNLRLASHSQNLANGKRHTDNRTGFKGVTKHNKRYRAIIVVRYKHIRLGTFDTPHEAHQAYKQAAQHYFKEFARCG